MGNSSQYRMSITEKEVLWELWHDGTSLHQVSRYVGISLPSVFLFLEKYGSYRPKPRVRRPTALSMQEREGISRGLASGSSIRMIAGALGRSSSTVSRVVNRNGGRS